MKINYGFIKNEFEVCVNPETAKVVKHIAKLYLQGYSLGGIANKLENEQIVSPKGNARWSRAVIDGILSNPVYVPHILTEETFYAIQFEKDRRSNINDNNTRKSTRYHSGDVLSGLLFCAECGSPYRRITKANKEVVWRCANRVEHGSLYCHNAPTVSDAKIKEAILQRLERDVWDESVIKAKISRIEINRTGDLAFNLNENFECTDCEIMQSML